MIVLTLFFFFGLTILFSDNHSGGAYGNRWHVLIVPLTLYGLFCLEPHEFFERRIIVSIFAVMSTWGLVLARIGLLDPWTPYFLEEPSFVVQFESGPPYWDHEQKMSDGFPCGPITFTKRFILVSLHSEGTQIRPQVGIQWSPLR